MAGPDQRRDHALRHLPVPKHRSSNDAARKDPGLAVRLRRSGLDRQLAHGADPADSPELALRAAQLGSHSERARIANALVEAVGDARAREPVTIRPRAQRAAVRENAGDILALALRLRDDRPACTAGVAMAAWLVGANESPMYRHDAGDLHEALRSALDALRESERETSVVVARAA